MIRRLLPHDSLRTRILLATGATITLVMMVVSWGILLQWRRTVLAKEQDYAHAVVQAFSVNALESLIAEENDLAPGEGSLEGYAADFVRQNPRLRHIVVVDADGDLIAGSAGTLPASPTTNNGGTLARPGPVSWFRNDGDRGWILETELALRTGSRHWGRVLVGIEADSVRRELLRAFLLLLGLVVAITGAMLAVLWTLLDRLLRSLRDLVGAMDRLDLGEAGLPELPPRADEIGVLFRHFQEMGQRLRRSRRELLDAREQVYHAERLAAAGRLAAGVAHEINNPINGVRNCIYAIRRDPTDTAQTLEYLGMMDEGLERAAAIVKKLLGFARKQEPARQPLELNAAIASVARLLSFDCERRRVRLDLDLAPDLPLVTGDMQLLQDVFTNLLINAVDAIGQDGAITVTSRHVDRQVRVTVADDGPGIRHEDLPRVFDPFFTTKAPGEGTGLGLSISLGIVEAHGGRIRAGSEPGGGAAFIVTLPTEDVT
ncbi:MAG: HAMP domain-containing protein [bacterium]|nr:HAMP domain-containing protein [bacterium]